jgi:hypothetical protein
MPRKWVVKWQYRDFFCCSSRKGYEEPSPATGSNAQIQDVNHRLSHAIQACRHWPLGLAGMRVREVRWDWLVHG